MADLKFKNMKEIKPAKIKTSERAFEVEDVDGKKCKYAVKITKQRESEMELHFHVTARRITADGTSEQSDGVDIETLPYAASVHKGGLVGTTLTIDQLLADHTMKAIERAMAHEVAMKAWQKIPEDDG